MPRPKRHIMQDLQFAYIDAIVAQAGATCTYNIRDYGIDARISEIVRYPSGRYRATGYAFECQLKASTTNPPHRPSVKFRMDAHTFNTLANMKSGIAIIIGFDLPRNQDEWLTFTRDSMSLHRLCYWMELTGQPSTEANSKTVTIPRDQMFQPDTIKSLLQRVRDSATRMEETT